jgi:hypothetical protein
LSDSFEARYCRGSARTTGAIFPISDSSGKKPYCPSADLRFNVERIMTNKLSKSLSISYPT